MALNIIFAGAPEFAAEHLRTLIQSEHHVIAAYTQPDRPAGRGRKLTASPVKALAVEHDIPVYQPLNFKADEAVNELKALGADIMVVVAYGIILPKVILDAPRLGCINVHASLLPRWRGAAPIHRALLAGDTESGVTVMQMDVGLDTGDMLVKASCPIYATDTSAVLHDRLVDLGGPALLTALNQLESGSAAPEQQNDDLANYAHKLEKAEGRINWQHSSEDIDRQIRGLTPWPGAFTTWQGENLRIHNASFNETSSDQPAGSIISMDAAGIHVAAGHGVLTIKTLQLPGKKAMSAADVLNSRREQFEATPLFD